MNEIAYFATGCFWGAERRFWKLSGVVKTSVGYMGGRRENPSYEQVCTGTTHHAETVSVEFDPMSISYLRLLEEFWTMHDPTSLNKQGGDIGTQYRSAIFTTTPQQMIEAINTRDVYEAELKKNGMSEIVTEIVEAKGHTYWLAEEYHQRYLGEQVQSGHLLVNTQIQKLSVSISAKPVRQNYLEVKLNSIPGVVGHHFMHQLQMMRFCSLKIVRLHHESVPKSDAPRAARI